MRSTTPDSEYKEIKTIYVDRVNSSLPKQLTHLMFLRLYNHLIPMKKAQSGFKSVVLCQACLHLIPRKSVLLVRGPIASLPPSKEISTTRIQKRGSAARLPSKANVPAINRCFVMPSIVPRDCPDGKYLVGSRRESIASVKPISSINAKPSHTRKLSGSRFDMGRMLESLESVPSDNMKNPLASKKDSNLQNRLVANDNAKESSEEEQSNIAAVAEKFDRTSLPATSSDQSLNSGRETNPVKVVKGVAIVHGMMHSLVERFEYKEKFDVDEISMSSIVAAEPVETPQSQNNDQQIVMTEQSTLDDNNIIENLMQNRDVLLIAFRSRLTKLQVVRHFWERNDVKGAINAVRKLPEYSVQADVVGVPIERMDVITLELFSCLLPVLLGILESNTERHAAVSLEMLLRLVAVFGMVVCSVGVDLHAEERIKCCRQCFVHFQNVQKTLPELVKLGGERVERRSAGYESLKRAIARGNVDGRMGTEGASAGHVEGWSAWAELILGAAVLRHGEHDWNVVASELRARTRYPTFFTPEVCKTKFKDLQKRYSGSRVWFEDLRKQCVAQLKQELERSEASIGFLESKIKYLEEEKKNSNQGDYTCSSPLVASNSSSKTVSKDEQFAGSYSMDSTRTSSSCERNRQEMEIDTKIRVSFSSEHDRDLRVGKWAGTGDGEGALIRKRRGQRKRKDCNFAVREGSVGDSDNLCSSNAVSSSHKEASTLDYVMKNHNGSSYTVERNNVKEIFQYIAQSEPAAVFRQRLDSQKRARYQKIIRQHVDIDMIRSRIIGKSIKTVKELFRDLLLLASNALVFYSSTTQEYKAALSLRQLVMKEYKLRCMGSVNAPTSAFLPFSPPAKRRTARPLPCNHKVSEKLSHIDSVVPYNEPEVLEKTWDSDYTVSLRSLLKDKKGSKQPGKPAKQK